MDCICLINTHSKNEFFTKCSNRGFEPKPCRVSISCFQLLWS